MADGVSRDTMHRSMTMLVLACALFLRVWVPAGWMPSADGGAFAIEPCVAAAPAPMLHASHHGSSHGGASHHGSSHQNQHDGDCSFAPHQAGIAPVAEMPALVAPAPVVAVLRQTSAASFFPTGPPAPPPPATGPPALA